MQRDDLETIRLLAAALKTTTERFEEMNTLLKGLHVFEPIVKYTKDHVKSVQKHNVHCRLLRAA